MFNQHGRDWLKLLKKLRVAGGQKQGGMTFLLKNNFLFNDKNINTICDKSVLLFDAERGADVLFCCGKYTVESNKWFHTGVLAVV